MTRLFNWLILFPLGLAFVVFSVSNRVPVSLDLWPFPYQVTVPFYLVFLGTLLVGFLIGGVVTSLAGARRRAQKAAAAKQKQRKAESATGLDLPSLPSTTSTDGGKTP